MFKRAFRPILLLGALLVASACASGGVRDPSTYTRELGRVHYNDIRAGVERIFQKWKHTTLRFGETYSTVYFETEWTLREPHNSEQAQGATQARERIILEGRRGGDFFRVQFKGECELLIPGMDGWQRVAISDPARQQFQRVFSDLEMETRAGIVTR